MNIIEIIEKKKQNEVLTEKELSFFIRGYTNGSIEDYQASALLMAICINGLSREETLILTKEMADSGEKLDLSDIPGIKADKHSSGGVGDKVTPVIAPIAAACGVKIVKMSGRGLGYTGGTLDKLSSIPGFRTELSFDEIIENTRKIGLCIGGQTKNLVPADKKLYALRDVTGTVNSLPLIASSIMSKKIVSGSDVLVLDVKAGKGALVNTVEDAEKLAELMVEIGNSAGIRTTALVTNMDEPLGYAVGNALEMIEVIDMLKNKPSDQTLKKLCIDISAQIVMLSGIADDIKQAEQLALEKVHNGEALEKFRQLVKMQNGDTRVIDDYALFDICTKKIECISKKSGYVHAIACDHIGRAACALGAGREKKDSILKLGAGIVVHKKCGDPVKAGESLATVYTEQENYDVMQYISDAYEINEKQPVKSPLIHKIISR